MTKRNNWFSDYQEIPGQLGGMRRLAKRTPLFDQKDFSGKKILDLGCNIGQMSFWAAEQGAHRVLGVEFDAVAFQAALELRNKFPESVQKVAFKLDDLDNPLFWHHLPNVDTTLLLSIIDTKELTNRSGILAKAAMKTNEVLYLEGHLRQSHLKYLNDLMLLTDFTQIRLLGQNEGRHLFRCSREVVNEDQCLDLIRDCAKRYRRIALIGNQLSGKSTLMSRLEREGGLQGFTLLDDCDDITKLCAAERLLLSDYRACWYLDDFEAVFYLLSPERRWEEKRPSLNFTRSPAARPYTALREFYTVASYQ